MGFIGELLHNEMFDTTFPLADIVNAGAEVTDYEFEVFPESFMAMGLTKLPILKGYDMWMDLEPMIEAMGIAAEAYTIKISFFNSESSEVDNSKVICQIIGYGMISAVGSVNQVDRGHGYFGEDGILLRPTVTMRCNVSNNCGSTITLDTMSAFFNAIIDWTDVSDAEFQEYLQELWFSEAFD